jgi:hypothetical protein
MAILLGENGYIDVATFKAEADLRGFDYSAYTDLQIEQAIVVSNLDYIDDNYTFKGKKLDDAQAMQLPTDEVAIADVKRGAYLAAKQQLDGKLYVDPAANGSGQVIMERDKLSKLETEKEYQPGTSATTTYNTSQIRKALKPYLAYQSGWLVV